MSDSRSPDPPERAATAQPPAARRSVQIGFQSPERCPKRGMSPASRISVEHVRKVYGATVAVDDASFLIARGAVHALLGENGAGKSTIVKLLSGLAQLDSGGFRLFGEEARFSSPRESQARGIQTAFQEMTLVDDLTVLDNMLLPRAPAGPTGMIRRSQARALVSAHFDALGMGDVRLDDEIHELDLAIQQKIEIARAIFREPRVLLLDEPTSTLSGRDVDWLGHIIAKMHSQGVTIVFISHRLREVRAFCDTMTVLRNGRHIATGPVSSYPDDEVIRMIAGRALSHAFPRREGVGAFGPRSAGGRAHLDDRQAARRLIQPARWRDPWRRRPSGHGSARSLPRLFRHG